MRFLNERCARIRAAEISAARGSAGRRNAGCRTAAWLVAACLAATWLARPADAATQESQWTTPNLDVWFYPVAESPGIRSFGPTFSGGLSIDEWSGQFEPHSANSPARLGTTLVAFNTTAGSVPIPKDLLPGQYHVTSATVTMTMANGSGQTLFYEPDPVSSADILSEITQQPPAINRQRPMELYGAQFRSGFTGIEFTPAPIGAPLFDESTHPYSAAGYRGFPVIGDEASPFDYVDVSNSLTGGFSATEDDGVTDPFDPQPWAIGTANLADGAAIPNNTTFEFELNLDLPGVRQYVRDSLSDGALGFFISSLHLTDDFGGSGGYPQWYLKEVGTLQPTLRIEFETLDEILAGDYDGNGAVEHDDYELWKLAFGKEVDAWYGADGNGDGFVNAADYTVWRNNLGATIALGSGALGEVVPEPGTAASFVWCVMILGARRGRRRRRGDRETSDKETGR